MKSILVAIDESKASYAALDLACELAKISGAQIKGLYVEDVGRLLEWQPTELIGSAIGASTAMPHVRPTEEQIKVEKEFEKERANLKEHFEASCKKNHIKGVFNVERGMIEECIIKLSKTVDLIVIGKRGKGYKEDSKEPGEIAEELLRNVTRPIFVVPTESHANTKIVGKNLTSKILLAYDSSEAAQRALSITANIAEILKAELLVISVANDTELAKKPLEEAKEFLTPYNLKVEYKTGIGAAMPWTIIINESKNYNPGIISIGAFGSNKLLELIFGSTTKQILVESTCPILLCK